MYNTPSGDGILFAFLRGEGPSLLKNTGRQWSSIRSFKCPGFDYEEQQSFKAIEVENFGRGVIPRHLHVRHHDNIDHVTAVTAL